MLALRDSVLTSVRAKSPQAGAGIIVVDDVAEIYHRRARFRCGVA